jgi:beta-galactosidase/beta-glucuronidase
VKLWTPESPYLYRLKIHFEFYDGSRDELESYVGVREIALGRDDKGVVRMLLNGKPVFHFGPLDQGWWPDGLYTAPTDEALKYDVEITKKLGFNMARKHVKVEPARWYYHCDTLGLLVWQDMPSGYPYAKWDPVGTHDNTEAKRSPSRPSSSTPSGRRSSRRCATTRASSYGCRSTKAGASSTPCA